MYNFAENQNMLCIIAEILILNSQSNMRTILLKTFCLVALVLCTVTALAERNYFDNSTIDAQWRKREIKIKGGSKAPSIMTLLKAFHGAMPTWSVEQVIKHGTQTPDGEAYQDADDWSVLVDRKQGYAHLTSETDINQMEACVWRKKDGHRFFAVSLYEQHVMPQNILCWYDYDPDTETLTPEESPVDAFLDVQTEEYRKRAIAGGMLSWSLPMKGTDFLLYEHISSLPTITHVHKWNGMMLLRSQINIEDFTFKWFGNSMPAKASEQGFNSYTIFNITDGENPTLVLRKTDEGTYGYGNRYCIFSSFKGDYSVVAVNNNMYDIEAMYHPKQVTGKPWKQTDAVTVTHDALGNKIYSVVTDGLVSYYVMQPADDNTGQLRRVIGYGASEETKDITTAEPASPITIDTRWFPCTITNSTEE